MALVARPLADAVIANNYLCVQQRIQQGRLYTIPGWQRKTVKFALHAARQGSLAMPRAWLPETPADGLPVIGLLLRFARNQADSARIRAWTSSPGKLVPAPDLWSNLVLSSPLMASFPDASH
jgi:hypothetical protein